MFAAAGVSLLALLFAGLFLYQAHAESLTYPPVGNTAENSASDSSVRGYLSDKVYLSARAPGAAPAVVASASAETPKGPIGEIHIANSGLVLLRGAQVISVRGSVIHVGIALGSSRFTWTAVTDNYTKFLTHDGEAQTLGDVAAGDILTVTGTLSAGGAEPTIDAGFVRVQ